MWPYEFRRRYVDERVPDLAEEELDLVRLAWVLVEGFVCARVCIHVARTHKHELGFLKRQV